MMKNILSFLALSFLATVAAPITVYFSNSADLTWQGATWLATWLTTLIVCLPILLVLNIYFHRLSHILNVSFLVLSCYIIIRIYIFPVSYGTIGGTEFDNFAILQDLYLIILIH